MALQNCKGCGKLIGETPSGYCDNCKKTHGDDTVSNFDKVRDYLYDFPGAHIAQVSEATGVSYQEIAGYVRNGRLEEIQGIASVDKRCSCGNPLEGSETSCKECKASFKKQAERVKKEISSKLAAAKPEEPAQKSGGYHASNIITKSR